MKHKTVEEDCWKKSAHRRRPSPWGKKNGPFLLFRAPILVSSMNAILLSFSPSTSPCYWDPEVTRREVGALTLICATDGKDYNAFTAGEVGGSFVGHAWKSTTASFTISTRNNRCMRLSLWRFGRRSTAGNEHDDFVIHCTSNRCDYCWI